MNLTLGQQWLMPLPPRNLWQIHIYETSAPTKQGPPYHWQVSKEHTDSWYAYLRNVDKGKWQHYRRVMKPKIPGLYITPRIQVGNVWTSLPGGSTNWNRSLLCFLLAPYNTATLLTAKLQSRRPYRVSQSCTHCVSHIHCSCGQTQL
jgi:hypothetical protein